MFGEKSKICRIMVRLQRYELKIRQPQQACQIPSNKFLVTSHKFQVNLSLGGRFQEGGERFWPWKYLPRILAGGSLEKPRAQDRAQRAPRRPKTPPRRLKTAQDAPKTAQDAPKTAPGGSKMPPRGLKRPSRGLKTPSRGPKRPPKGPKTRPRAPRDLQKH